MSEVTGNKNCFCRLAMSATSPCYWIDTRPEGEWTRKEAKTVLVLEPPSSAQQTESELTHSPRFCCACSETGMMSLQPVMTAKLPTLPIGADPKTADQAFVKGECHCRMIVIKHTPVVD